MGSAARSGAALLRGVRAFLARHPRLVRALEIAVRPIEFATKKPAFGCRMCGQCVLHETGLTCPMGCPKSLRNGPCGGTRLGRCEVVDRPCIWGDVYERAKAAGRVEVLAEYIPPPDRSLQGTSSWINYFLERDSRPGR